MVTENSDLRVIKYDIKHFISSIGYMEVTMIRDDTMIFQECLMESIGLIQLVAFLEERYGIQASDSDLVEENFESINAIVNFVKDKLSTKYV